MRIVIELDAHEVGDGIVVRVSRKGGQAAFETEAVPASEIQDAGPAPEELFAINESVEVNDAGPAPESGADAGASA